MIKTKKELKDAYKLVKTQMGVFQIRNKVNGKVFLDSSLNIKSKQNRHIAELKFGNHRHKDLQNDWNTLGTENFIFEVLAEIEPKDEDNLNYSRELKTLEDLVIEDLHLTSESKYK